MRGLVEAVLSARMGTPLRWLVGSSWVTNLGDRVALAAGPQLVAGQTRDPLLIALGALLQRLPWLLFGLLARAWGITGPFWFGFVGSAVILALIWRQLVLIAHACDEFDEAVPAR